MSTPQRRWPCGAHAEDVNGRKHLASLSARGGGLEGPAKPGVAGLCLEGENQRRTVATLTADRGPRADWLLAAGCTPSALARTGGSWRPVCKRREAPLTLLRGHAHPIQAVPGRKTAVRDGEGMGDGWRHGLLTASVIPPRSLRERRAWTRHRQLLGRARAAGVPRLPTLRDSAHRTRGHVATTVLGLSGRFRLQARAAGDEEAAPRAPLAQGKLQATAAHLHQSRPGHLPPTPRVLRQDL